MSTVANGKIEFIPDILLAWQCLLNMTFLFPNQSVIENE